MVVMTLLPQSRPLTRADLDAMPDDGHRYELIDGALAVSTVVQPDVLVARRCDLTARDLPTAPVLAVEVLSPSTRKIDLTLKRATYEAAGCPSYWVVDPDGPAITAWELRDGAYVESAQAVAGTTFEVGSPFPLAFDPMDLLG